MDNNDLIRRGDVERWILTECACIDTPADRDAVVDNMRHAIPAVDAVEVVRCPSCLYQVDDGYHECIEFGIRIPDDAEFFCKYGKHRGGKHNAAD